MKHTTIQKTVLSACFAAFIFLGTQFIKIPLAFGYFHLGDIFVLLAGYFIGGGYAAMASAIGSVGADLLSGYGIYAPATLIIKPLMAFTVFAFCRRAQNQRLRFALGAALSELIMVLGYFLFDSLLYGFSAALVSLPSNLLQGTAGTVGGIAVLLLLDKARLLNRTHN